MMKTPSDIKTQVVQVCETLYQYGDMALKKITGRLVAKETDFSHTAVMPYVNEWREEQYRMESMDRNLKDFYPSRLSQCKMSFLPFLL